ncbi:MAG: glycosyltransferase family 2 protein [Acidobacteria bacterium]|nr:glycosyltransferase family 2 protein [Acidobacteriota bacterium]
MQDLAVNLFVFSVAVIVYTIAGYPFVLALLTSLRRRRVDGRRFEPRSVTVLLAVHNGEAWIARKLASLLALDYPRELVHVLVLDDGSTDGTAEVVRRVTDPRVELVTLPHGGKAQALNAGLARARGEILFFTDVRQPLHPQSLRRLVERFADPRVGVVSGELVIHAANREESTVGLYWKYEKWIRRQQSLLNGMTGATGCIYAMRRELAVPLPPDTLVDDMFLPLSARLRGSRIVFEPGAKAFDCGTTPAEEFRRKVRTLAGNVQVVRALPRLLWSSNGISFHFVSHKLARLVLPYAILLMGLSSLLLPSPGRAVMLAVQGLSCLLAVVDLRVPPSWRVKRVSSSARTFLVLVAAALCAPPASLLGRAAVWRPTRAAVAGSGEVLQGREANWRRAPAVVR